MKFLNIICAFLLLGCEAFAQNKGMLPVNTKTPAGTERRLALVIGNKNYTHAGRLNNTHNDADDMAKVLQNLGFDVILKKELKMVDFLKTIDDFGVKLGHYNVGLLYYSGHGIQFQGENYLVPIDAKVNAIEDIEYTCVKLSRAMTKMEGAKLKISLAFLDACRNNPFPSSSRSLGQGLTIPNNPPGSFVAFSTRAGSTADDNSGGRNGLFTAVLLQNLPQANVSLRTMIDNTIKQVSKQSNKAQIPGRYDELTGDFYFLVSGSSIPEKPKPVVSQEEPEKPKKDLLPYEPIMVFVTGGSFEMGSNIGDDDEKPVHSVNLSDYFIGKYEVTQVQWKAVMGENPSYYMRCDSCPVERVSWDDVQVYLEKLNRMTGKSYRLPTEAEWEYAARGGQSSRAYVYAGGNSAETVGWIWENSGNKTHQIGLKPANELGIYDMTGNVWEWCNDWYEPYSSSNPDGSSSSTYKVLRGGSWYADHHGSRITNRYNYATDYRDYICGFRVALTP